MRPFLPPLLAGAAARADVGLDFEGSGYEFLESPGFLAAVLALAVLFYAFGRARDARTATPQATREERGRGRAGTAARDPLGVALAAAAVALGALLFAGSLDAGGEQPWLGFPAGAACAMLAFAAVTALLARVRRRLEDSAAALLAVWADAASLVLAAVAIAFPPASLVGLAGLAYVLVALRRADRGKYEGLRVLR